jgi:hypothetical protein
MLTWLQQMLRGKYHGLIVVEKFLFLFSLFLKLYSTENILSTMFCTEIRDYLQKSVRYIPFIVAQSQFDFLTKIVS